MDVVKSVRKKPFGEWNIVYFDASKTTPERILKRLRAKGCPRARLLAGTVAKTKGLEVAARNLIATPGDCFRLEVTAGKAVKPRIRVPRGWRVVAGKPGSGLWYVQTPAEAKPGRYAVKAADGARRGGPEVRQERVRRRRVELQVELVTRVR